MVMLKASKRLRELRVEGKGWAQARLAKEAEVSPQTVRKAENGVPISEVCLARMANALGVSLKDLLDK